jgi:signal transduction histidine kinase
VVAAAIFTFVVSSVFKVQERRASIEIRFERWQLDELPLSLVVPCPFLAACTWRRGRQAARLLDRNRELARQLIALQESERRAIARELHDELAQHCTALRIEAPLASRAQRRLTRSQAPPDVPPRPPIDQ